MDVLFVSQSHVISWCIGHRTPLAAPHGAASIKLHYPGGAHCTIFASSTPIICTSVLTTQAILCPERTAARSNPFQILSASPTTSSATLPPAQPTSSSADADAVAGSDAALQVEVPGQSTATVLVAWLRWARAYQ